MVQRKRLVKAFVYFIVLFFVARLIGSYCRIPHPWGYGIKAEIGESQTIHVRSRGIGGEVDFQVTIYNKGVLESQWICESVHASNENIQIFLVDNERDVDRNLIMIDIKDNSPILLNMDTMDCDCFVTRPNIEKEWASKTEIAKGFSGSYIEPILPW